MVAQGKGWGEGKVREFGTDMCTLLYLKTDSQQGPAVEHRELFSMLCGSLDGRGAWGRMGPGTCIAEPLCCPPEMITTLLITQESVIFLVVSSFFFWMDCIFYFLFFYFILFYFKLYIIVLTPRLQPSRLFCAWRSPGKNTGVSSHSLL